MCKIIFFSLFPSLKVDPYRKHLLDHAGAQQLWFSRWRCAKLRRSADRENAVLTRGHVWILWDFPRRIWNMEYTPTLVNLTWQMMNQWSGVPYFPANPHSSGAQSLRHDEWRIMVCFSAVWAVYRAFFYSWCRWSNWRILWSDCVVRYSQWISPVSVSHIQILCFHRRLSLDRRCCIVSSYSTFDVLSFPSSQ